MKNLMYTLGLVGFLCSCGASDAGEKLVDKIISEQGKIEDIMSSAQSQANDFEGQWMSNALGIKQIRKFNADGTGFLELYVEGELQLSFEIKILSSEKGKFSEVITKIDKSSKDFPVIVDMQNFCIYTILDLSGELQLECDSDYPNAFSDDVTTFVRTGF